MVTICLAPAVRPKAVGGSGRPERRCRRGRLERRCRRGQAANPGTSRALLVPLFGLAPGGVWPRLRRRSRRALLPPDFTLTRRCRRPGAGRRYVSVPLSVPAGRNAAGEAWALPSTLPGGARTFLPAPASRRAAATRPAQPSTAQSSTDPTPNATKLRFNHQPPISIDIDTDTEPPLPAPPLRRSAKSPPFAKGGMGGLEGSWGDYPPTSIWPAFDALVASRGTPAFPWLGRSRSRNIGINPPIPPFAKGGLFALRRKGGVIGTADNRAQSRAVAQRPNS